MSDRLPSLDVAKGIAIIVVALFHTADGFVNAGRFGASDTYLLLVTLAYGFHVQVFFILSGYFVFEKSSNPYFQIRRFINLYYSYILWSIITFSAVYMNRGAVNRPLEVDDLLFIPIVPIQHYWFLIALIIGTLALGVLRTPERLIIASAVLAICAQLHWDWLEIGYFFPLMALGALLHIKGCVPKPSPAGGGVAAAITVAGAAIAADFETTMRLPAFYIFSIAGCYALYVGSSYLSRTPIGEFLAYIGRKSMAIYLSHVLFAAAARVFIFKYLPIFENIYGVLLAGIASVGVPVMLCMAAGRLRIVKWLGFAPLLRETRQPLFNRRRAFEGGRAFDDGR